MTFDIPTLIILSIATWRLAFFVSHEQGPFAFMSRIRAKTDGGGLLTCIKCVSVWAALLLLIAYYSPLVPLVWVLAVSGLALMLSSYTGAGAVNHD